MRFPSWLSAALAAALAILFAPAAGAHVLIRVDKSTQQMTVSVDGTPRYHFTVSTGRPGLGTPSGTFHPERMELTWFSKKYYNSPMPHSIFFHAGFAIHGSYEIDALGGPASHGCIRLHPDNAATLYGLVEREGMAVTTIVVSGELPARRRPPATPEQGEYPPPAARLPPADNLFPPIFQQSPYYQQSPGYNYCGVTTDTAGEVSRLRRGTCHGRRCCACEPHRIGVCAHDPQAEIRTVPALFAQKGCKYREAPQSRHFQHPGRR